MGEPALRESVKDHNTDTLAELEHKILIAKETLREVSLSDRPIKKKAQDTGAIIFSMVELGRQVLAPIAYSKECLIQDDCYCPQRSPQEPDIEDIGRCLTKAYIDMWFALQDAQMAVNGWHEKKTQTFILRTDLAIKKAENIYMAIGGNKIPEVHCGLQSALFTEY
jgi:hypothetical protein